MSTTTNRAPAQPAPWKKDFLEHVSKMQSPEFVFSTLAVAPKGSSTPYLPRARYCIFRSMWAELPENKHNTAELNPRVYETDLPAFSTDVRMEKVFEIFGSSSGHADRVELVQGSGGGGPCEAVFWIDHEEVMTQWRFKGHAFIVGPDIEKNEESSGVRTVKSEIGERMRVVEPGKEGDWSWQRELDGHFGNSSPGIRGSMRNPPPGRPVTEPYNEEEKVGDKVETLDDPIALKHFRIVVVKPDSVEKTVLKDPKKARRYLYEYQSDSGEWKETEEWP
ncbi:hypothetical protein EJ08DRAFT_648044 [Tothia fuscella]|uniref:Pyridoxamine 5'-phosphate oxidase Alr4036 family FMN-binding domain-containing protein n=1 Tax=Tothia fuscella TaxID=1048955 RepID=A0A9P4NVQ8_9PEZI|nr:hypothetical protein EJ08DRAFT_648044 [Tothia fuscella]